MALLFLQMILSLPRGVRSSKAKQWLAVLRKMGSWGFCCPAGSAVTSFLFQPCPSSAGREGCLSGGVTQRKQGRGESLGEECKWRSACFSSPLGPVQEAEEADHHSTRKRISTTSRTAKRMAMAHHWRRSGRQDTEDLPETQVPKHLSRGTEQILPLPRHQPPTPTTLFCLEATLQAHPQPC